MNEPRRRKRSESGAARSLANYFWFGVGLSVVYWADRLHNLLAFPVFTDEAVHVRWAKMVWYRVLFGGANDGRLSNIWLYSAFWPFGPPNVWVARTASLLAGIVGFACLVKSGELLFGRRAGLLAGVVFILLPFAFFFERMALADPLGVSLLSITMMGSIGAISRADRRWVLIGGVALAGLLLAKLSNLIYVAVPLSAAIFLRSRLGKQASLGRAAWLCLVAAGLVAPVALYLVFKERSTLGMGEIALHTGSKPLQNRLVANAATFASFLGPYLTWPVVVLVVAGLLVGLRRCRRETLWTILVAGSAVTLVGVGSNWFTSRYIMAMVLGVALLAGHGFQWLIAQTRRLQLPFVAVTLCALGMLAAPLGFQLRGWYHTAQLPLPRDDRLQYIENWSSGYGITEIAEYLLMRSSTTPLTVFTTDPAYVQFLSLPHGYESRFHIWWVYSEPQMNLVQIMACDQTELTIANDGEFYHFGPTQFEAEVARGGFALGAGERSETYLVAERGQFQPVVDCLPVSKKLIATYVKPGGSQIIDLFEIAAPRVGY